MSSLHQINVSELAELLNQRDYAAGYLDPSTGAVHPVFDGQIAGLDEDGPVDTSDADLDGFISLGGASGTEVYRDMELFAEHLGDRHIRDQLKRALEGPRPMRAFRSVVHSTPEMLGRTWNQFEDLRAQLRALDFLAASEFEGQPLVARSELDERRDQLTEETNAALDGLGPMQRGRLILLNGLPDVGKSTLARAYVASRPGVLNLDIDVLRTMLGGPWEETAELGRSLALEVITAHLGSGNDVVVPQLVANPEQLRRFEAAAEGFGFVLVVLDGESRVGDQPWQQDVPDGELHRYAENLDRLAEQQIGVHRLQTVEGDVPATVAALAELLDF